jgi:hypothetical protein
MRRSTFWRCHARLGTSGQCVQHGLHALLHQLSRVIDVRSPAELGKDEREADIRIGAKSIKPANSLHGAFERLRDECLDFLRSKAGCFGQDRDRGLRHVWQHLDRQLRECLPPKQQHHQRRHENERTMMQGKADELVQHGFTSCVRILG